MAHLELRRLRSRFEGERLVRVTTAELQYVEALGDYVNLHTTPSA